MNKNVSSPFWTRAGVLPEMRRDPSTFPAADTKLNQDLTLPPQVKTFQLLRHQQHLVAKCLVLMRSCTIICCSSCPFCLVSGIYKVFRTCSCKATGNEDSITCTLTHTALKYRKDSNTGGGLFQRGKIFLEIKI